MSGEEYLAPSGVRRDRTAREVGGPPLEVGGVQTVGAAPVGALLGAAVLPGSTIADPDSGLPTVLGGRVQTPHIVVAADDSTDAAKAYADVICAADATEGLQLAYDLAYASGCDILLVEGTFVVNGAVIAAPDVAVRGAGAGSVLWLANRLTADTALFVGPDARYGSVAGWARFCDMTVYSEGGTDARLVADGATALWCERVMVRHSGSGLPWVVDVVDADQADFLECDFGADSGLKVAREGCDLRLRGCRLVLATLTLSSGRVAIQDALVVNSVVEYDAPVGYGSEIPAGEQRMTIQASVFRDQPEYHATFPVVVQGTTGWLLHGCSFVDVDAANVTGCVLRGCAGVERGGALTPLNSWVAYGSPYGDPSYVMDADGYVTLSGVVKTGAEGTTIATLPEGFRPAVRRGFAVALSSSASGFGRVDVNTDGNIIAVKSSAVFTALDGIRFYVG